MTFFRTQFISSITTLLLVLCILAPTAVKLSHAIYEHEGLECTATGAVHVHEIEFDCDFHKFKLSTQYYTVPLKLDVKMVAVKQVHHTDFYISLSKFQKRHFALRGPPIS